jgi:hypothetical protein
MYLTELLRNSPMTGSLSETSLSNKANNFAISPTFLGAKTKYPCVDNAAERVVAGIKSKTAIESTHM